MDLVELKKRVFKAACRVSIGRIEKELGIPRDKLKEIAAKELREGARIKNGTGVKINHMTESTCLKCDRIIKTRELRICRNCKSVKNYANAL